MSHENDKRKKRKKTQTQKNNQHKKKWEKLNNAKVHIKKYKNKKNSHKF